MYLTSNKDLVLIQSYMLTDRWHSEILENQYLLNFAA